jgi:anti-anti-sigma regulatory factor
MRGQSASMLRIATSEPSTQPVTLTLEGRVIGPWVEELRRASERVLGEGRRLVLDLAQVSFVDRDGIALFGLLRDRGVALRHCSPFVTEQLRGVLREVAS